MCSRVVAAARRQATRVLTTVVDSSSLPPRPISSSISLVAAARAAAARDLGTPTCRKYAPGACGRGWRERSFGRVWIGDPKIPNSPPPTKNKKMFVPHHRGVGADDEAAPAGGGHKAGGHPFGGARIPKRQGIQARRVDVGHPAVRKLRAHGEGSSRAEINKK